MKRVFKVKILFGIILGLFISATVVYATEIYNARDILFSSSKGLNSTNLQDAIDEVHQKIIDLQNQKNEDIIIYKYNENKTSNSYCIYGYESTCKMLEDRSISTMRNLKKGDIVSIKIPNSSTRMGFWIMGKHIDYSNGNEVTNMYDLISQDNFELSKRYPLQSEDGASNMLNDLQLTGKFIASVVNRGNLQYTFGSQKIRNTNFIFDNTLHDNTITVNYGNNKTADILTDAPVYAEENNAFIGSSDYPYFKFATLQDIERLCVRGEKRESEDYLFSSELLGSERVGQYVLESCPAFMNNPMRLANYVSERYVYLFNYEAYPTYNLAPVLTPNNEGYGFKFIMSYYID